MKIIKQNDIAGGLVFKQNDNNKALKQNYTYSTGIKHIHKLAIPVFDTTTFNSLSIQTIVRLPIIRADTDIVRLVSPSNSTVLEFETYFTAVYTRTPFLTSFLITGGSGTNLGGVLFGGVSYSRNNYYHFDNNKRQSIINTNLNALFSSNKLYLVYDNSPNFITHEVLIYNRDITLDEQLYQYNNFLGNEPLSNQGLVSRFVFNRAEILDDSGVNKVGITDIVSSKNAFFEGLPAGDLVTQLNYVNTNILVR